MPGPRLVFALCALCCACGPGGEAGPDTLDSTTDGIVRGSAQPTVLTLTARQKLAVGALLDSWQGWANKCTGTLIAPTLVATAAHCVEGSRASELAFAIGDDAAAPKESDVPSAIYSHPGYDPDGDAEDDFAVLRFSTPFTSADPISPNCEAPPSSLQGKRLQTAGYGETLSNEDNTRRYWAAVTLQRIGSYDLTTNGFGSGGCYGDSGGPLLASLNGEARLVGTLSWGEQCGDEDHYVRVDTVCAFLKTVPGFNSASPAPSPAPSGSQTIEGVTFTTAQATKALQLANTASEATLDGAVGLDARAAKGIVAARPHANLAAVAVVPYVAATALTKLRDY